MRRIKTIILLCSVLLLFKGCFKSVSYDTSYVVRPFVQLHNQGPIESFSGVKVYAYDVDTMEWKVASYADAVAGVVSSKFVPPQRLTTPSVIAVPYPAETPYTDQADWLQMQTLSPQMMVIAVDTIHQLYAYRNQVFAENLSPLYTSVVFRPWKNSYMEGGWHIVNDFFVGTEQGPKPEEPDNTPENPAEPSPSE